MKDWSTAIDAGFANNKPMTEVMEDAYQQGKMAGINLYSDKLFKVIEMATINCKFDFTIEDLRNLEIVIKGLAEEMTDQLQKNKADAIVEYKQILLDELENKLKRYYSTVDRAISEDELKIEGIKVGYMDAIELIEDMKEKKDDIG